MSEEKDSNPQKPNSDEIKEEIRLQFHWYFLGFFIIYWGSFLVPGFILIYYILIIFLPNFLEVRTLVTLFTNLTPIIVVIATPLVLIGCYLVHMLLVGVFTRVLWRLTEKKSPSKEEIIPRSVPSKTLNFYHIRSFLIKYGKNIFIKGPFPWLANWFFNFIGSNIIGKGSTIEEEVCADKFCEIGKNCYIGVNSVLTTHLVEGIFGRITYFKIRIGDNCTFTALGMVAPGGKFGDNTYFFPYGGALKYSEIKGDNYYFGTPIRKIFKKKVMEYLGLTEEDFKKEQILREKQQQLKEKSEIHKEEVNNASEV